MRNSRNPNQQRNQKISSSKSSLQVSCVGICLGLGAALTTLIAHANEVQSRYLVQYHSPSVVQNVAKELNAIPSLSRGRVVSRPRVRVIQQNLRIQEALTNTRMLVVEATESEVKSLKNDPNVALIEKEFFYASPEPMSTRSSNQNSTIQPKNLPDPADLYNDGEITWGLKAVRASQAWNLLKGDTSRIGGRGTRVLVLDTGIDRDHSDIRTRFEAGRNFLTQTAVAPMGLNIFAAGLNPFNSAESPAYDYYDDNGHGTHVAGTILGSYNGSGVSGVAPLAHLLAGRVCGQFGCTSVGIVRGIEWGVQQAVNVINMSLGGPMPSTAAREAVAAADAANVVVVCASGNDGRGTISFPAAYEHSVAVGAIDSRLAKASFSNWGPELSIAAPGVDILSSVPTGSGRESKVEVAGVINGVIKSKGFVGAEEVSTPITANLHFVGLGKEEDFANLDLTGKFALIQRGEIPFKDKVTNAIAAKAIGVLIFNNESGLISGALTQDGSSVGIPVAMIEKSTGEAIADTLSKGNEATASIVVERTNYSAFNGTSMASPHVAGVVALIRAANPNLKAPQVRQIIKDTAVSMQANPARPNEFGAGLINAEAAVLRALAN